MAVCADQQGMVARPETGMRNTGFQNTEHADEVYGFLTRGSDMNSLRGACCFHVSCSGTGSLALFSGPRSLFQSRLPVCQQHLALSVSADRP